MSYTDGAPEPPPPEQGIDWSDPKYGGQPKGIDWSDPKYGGKKAGEDELGKAFASGLTRGAIGATTPTGGVAGRVADWIYPGAGAYVDPVARAIAAPATYGAQAGAYLAGKVRPDIAQYTAPVVAPPSPEKATQEVQSLTAGTPFDPSYQPQSFPGKVAQTAGSMTPYLAIPGGEAGIPERIASEVVAPAVGTETLKATPLGQAHPEIASLAGALAGGTAAKTALEGARQTAGVLRPPVSPETMAQTEALGMAPLPRFAATDYPKLVPWAANFPLTGGVMRGAATRAQSDLEAAGGRVLERAGATTPAAAGEDVASSFANWQKGLSDAASTRYQAVENALPAGSETVTSPLSNTQAAADAITARNATSGAGPGPAVGAAQGGLDMGNMGYQGMRDLRTRLRQQGEGAGLTPTERAQFGNLQDAVTQDINTHLDRLDPSGQAKSLLADADQTYRSDQGRLQAVGRKLGIDNPSVSNEQYLGKIESMARTKGDTATLQQAMNALPQNIRDQTAGTIAKGWWSDAQGNMTPENFAKKYDSLTPEGKDALFGKSGSGGLRDSYDALSAVSQRNKMLQNVAGTGGFSSSLLPHIIETASEVGTGMLAHEGPLGAAAAIGSNVAQGSLPFFLSRPATASSYARLARAAQGFDMTRLGGQATAGASRIVAAAANDFAREANAAGGNVDPNKITQQLVQ
jgi:hypothetical protein